MVMSTGASVLMNVRLAVGMHVGVGRAVIMFMGVFFPSHVSFALLSVIVVFVVVRMTVSIALIAFLMSMMVNFFSAVGIRVSVELLAVGMPVVVAMGFALLSVIVVFVVVRMTVSIALIAF